MRCIEHIKDIALDCQYRPTKGLKHRVLVIPYKDIDRRYTTMNDDKSVITHFQLYPTKRGYLFELSNAFKVNGSQKLSGGFVHELSIKIDKANSDNIATINALTKGTYVLVVETMINTFEILGYDAGVVVSSIQRDYAGNVIGLTFTTPSDVKELRMIALWGEGDYIAMSNKFERKAFVGRNYILKSNDFITNGYKYLGISSLFRNEVVKSDSIALSVDVMFNNLTKGGRLGIEFSIIYTDNTEVYYNVWKWLNNSDIGTSFSERMVSTIQNNHKGKKIKYISPLGLHIQCEAESVKVSNPKLEIGNIATDWCPADED